MINQQQFVPQRMLERVCPTLWFFITVLRQYLSCVFIIPEISLYRQAFFEDFLRFFSGGLAGALQKEEKGA